MRVLNPKTLAVITPDGVMMSEPSRSTDYAVGINYHTQRKAGVITQIAGFDRPLDAIAFAMDKHTHRNIDLRLYGRELGEIFISSGTRTYRIR